MGERHLPPMNSVCAIGALLLAASTAQAQFNGCGSAVCSAHLGGTGGYVAPTVAPTIAQNWGYTSLKFNETWSSSSTIDYSNSRLAGYNWYIQYGRFPMNYNGNANWSWMSSIGVNPAGDMVISNNTLTLLSTTGGAPTMWSCMWDATNTHMVGNWWGGGFYIEVQFAFDPAFAPGGGARPSWWMLPEEALGSSAVLNQEMMEIDVESLYGPAGDPYCGGNCWMSMYLHDWNFGSDGPPNTQNNEYQGFSWTQVQSAFGSNFTYNALNTYGVLVVPSTQNSGTGIIAHYVNGVLMFQVTYGASGLSPALSPANPNLTALDNEHWCLMLGNGIGWPAQFGAVRVWQKP